MIHSSVPALLAAALAAVAPASAGPVAVAQAGPSPAEIREEVQNPVFRIDDALVPVDRYGEWISHVMGPAEAYNYALVHLTDREAERLGVELTEAEVSAAVEDEIRIRVENAFHGDPQGWIDELKRVGRSPGEYRRARSVELRPWLLATKLADIDREVPEQKIVRDWELHYGPGGRRYDLRMLLLRVVQEMPADGTPVEVRNLERERRELARLEEAKELRARVVAGEDLGELASRRSDDRVTRENGGRLPEGWSQFGWPKTFVDALAELSPGDLSEPLYAKGGWWLVEVVDVDETPLEDVRDELVADLRRRGPESDEVAIVQQRLLEGVEIEVLPALFEPRRADEQREEFPDAFEPVLKVGDDVVRRGEYALWLMHTHGSAFANRYVEDWLVERKARELGVTVTDEDVRARIREHLDYRIENAYRGSREAFEAYLSATGLNERDYAQRYAWRARSDLLVERLIQLERQVSAEDLRLAWEDHYGKDGVGQEVRSFAVPIELPELPPGLTPEGFDRIVSEAAEVARQRTAKLVERIERGEDFASVAERVSMEVVPEGIDPEPHRFRPDTWPPEVADVVSPLAAGEVTPPIRLGPTFVVFECLGRREVPFEEVEGELRDRLLQARPASIQVATYRNVLLKQADVEVLPALYE